MTMWDTLAGNHTVDATGRILTVASNDYTNYCSQAAGDKKSSGKWYYEVVLTTVTDASTVVIGLTAIPVATFPGQVSGSYGYQATWKSNAYAKRVTANISETHGPNFGPGTAIGAGTVVGVAVDADNDRIYYSTNGLWRRYNNTTYGSPILDVDLDRAHYSTSPIWPAIGAMVAGTVLTANFAAADLIYDPPSGFLPWYEPIPVPIRTTLYQPWATAIQSSMLQSWLVDAQVNRSLLSQPWGNAVINSVSLLAKYRDMLMLRSSLGQKWEALTKITSLLKSSYSITNSILKATLVTNYNISQLAFLQAVLSQQYWLTGNSSTSTLAVQYIEYNGERLELVSVDFKSDIDQYALSATIELASYSDFNKLSAGSEVLLYGVLDKTFTFIVDGYSYDEAYNSGSFKVELLSPTVLLDVPYADLVSGDYVGMASDICQTLADSVGVDWQIIDWYIGDGILSADQESPLSVIKKVVNAVGGRLQSTFDGGLIAVSRYPKSCNIWNIQPTVATIDAGTNVISNSYTYEPGNGYNYFNVKNDSLDESIFRLDVEEVSPFIKTVSVYVYPDIVPTFSHSGNEATVSVVYDGRVETTESDEVEFVNGEGSVDGPLTSVTGSWRYRNLGSIAFEPTGVLTSSIYGDSLADISYTTFYYKYTISNTVSETVQIIVEVE